MKKHGKVYSLGSWNLACLFLVLQPGELFFQSKNAFLNLLFAYAPHKKTP